ncbi:MAG TPA: PAS domain-containing protein [Vicinamibacterales bacterium]|nr:PAS domain-containing protein [Vicinamibacterales bacterium]
MSARRTTNRSRGPRHRFEELVAGIDGVVWEADARTFQFTFVSPQAERLFGYRCEEWLEPDFWAAHLHPDDRAAAVELCIEATRAKRNHTFEYRMVTADGRTVWVRDVVTVLVEDGEPTTLRGVMVDVTERRQAEITLRETLDRLRFATHAANVGLWDWDLRDNRVVFSREWKSQLGYEEAEIAGEYSEWETRLHPDDLGPSLAVLRAYLAGETSEYSVEFRMRHKDGSWRWIHARGDVLRDDTGKPTHMLGCHIDVTERKQTEHELRENQRRLLEAERVARLGYWERDYERGHIRWSDEAYRIWGLEPGSPLDGDDLMQRVHADDRARVLASIASSLEYGTPHNIEYRAVRSDGDVRMLHSQGDLLRDAAGRPQRFFGTVQDVTDRRRAEQAMVESHNLLNAVLEGTDDAVFVKDYEGCYLMVNSAAARNLGRPALEVIGLSDEALWARAEVAAVIAEQDRDVMHTGKSRTFEMDLVSRDGTARTLLTRKSAFRDASGRVVGLIGISRDISEQKHLEEQFRQAQKMEAVGRLAGGVAHDFNNLLTVIHGFAQLVFDRLPSGDESRESLTEVIGAAERATNLTRQLLVFSRKQTLRPRTVDVNVLVGDLLRLLRRLIGEDIEFSLTLHTAAAFTEVDPGQFEQAIINLAVNARDAMPNGGRLAIETGEADVVERLSNPDVRAGRYVRITVRDSGVGMDDATQARIFEPFFTTKGPGHGTGLGLAMVYGFVRQSGGFIDVSSTRGAGTTFDVYLPVASPASFSSHVGEREPAWMPTGTETILLVEDETAVRSFARAVLESSGYTVLVAPDGEEGLARAAAHTGRLDLVLTDLVMPKVGGRQLAETLRRSRPDLKLLFMSGYSDQPVPSGNGGTNGGFLQKPFVALDLVRKVRRVLDAPAVKL